MSSPESDTVVVETANQWQTGSLLRKLRGCNAFAIQIAADRWIVRGRVGGAAHTTSELQALVEEWAAEQRARPLAITVGGTLVPLPEDA